MKTAVQQLEKTQMALQLTIIMRLESWLLKEDFSRLEDRPNQTTWHWCVDDDEGHVRYEVTVGGTENCIGMNEEVTVLLPELVVRSVRTSPGGDGALNSHETSFGQTCLLSWCVKNLGRRRWPNAKFLWVFIICLALMQVGWPFTPWFNTNGQHGPFILAHLPPTHSLTLSLSPTNTHTVHICCLSSSQVVLSPIRQSWGNFKGVHHKRILTVWLFPGTRTWSALRNRDEDAEQGLRWNAGCWRWPSGVNSSCSLTVVLSHRLLIIPS